MTTGQIILLIIAGLIVLGIVALRHLAKATAADPLDTEDAPEAEADRRVTHVFYGNDHFIL